MGFVAIFIDSLLSDEPALGDTILQKIAYSCLCGLFLAIVDAFL
ncbi:MAG: hypothetical protein Q4A84_01155 [Neisseria sp.]|nr:hypothetical protein [Neisseria sp.]MDO4640301.1 hypothetical protein [Neisseria sp.]